MTLIDVFSHRIALADDARNMMFKYRWERFNSAGALHEYVVESRLPWIPHHERTPQRLSAVKEYCHALFTVPRPATQPFNQRTYYLYKHAKRVRKQKQQRKLEKKLKKARHLLKERPRSDLSRK